MDCRLATWPTRRSPPLVIATTDGVVLAPSWFGITTGSPPCITATTELVVPRSIPIILLMDSAPNWRHTPSVGSHGLRNNAIIHIECCIVKFLVCLYSAYYI